MNLTKLSINELISLRDEIEGLIYSHDDGYLYICSVRQFGSVWEERPKSLHSLRELCNSYYGDNGIVDVYTNNPNLEFPEMEFENYGDVMYIRSEGDYKQWVEHTKRKNLIKDVTQQLDEWDESKNLPFRYRPSFAPMWTREDVTRWIEEFENAVWDFEPPRDMKPKYFDNDEIEE